MRLKCPYCEKAFAVYPIPATLASRQRRAGMIALGVQSLLAFIAFAAVGPRVVSGFVSAMERTFTPHIGMGLAAMILGWPLLFAGLAVYDRCAPHFGRALGDDLHCLKCGHTGLGDDTLHCQATRSPGREGAVEGRGRKA